MYFVSLSFIYALEEAHVQKVCNDALERRPRAFGMRYALLFSAAVFHLHRALHVLLPLHACVRRASRKVPLSASTAPYCSGCGLRSLAPLNMHAFSRGEEAGKQAECFFPSRATSRLPPQSQFSVDGCG
jgi:hypothetical protein